MISGYSNSYSNRTASNDTEFLLHHLFASFHLKLSDLMIGSLRVFTTIIIAMNHEFVLFNS